MMTHGPKPGNTAIPQPMKILPGPWRLGGARKPSHLTPRLHPFPDVSTMPVGSQKGEAMAEFQWTVAEGGQIFWLLKGSQKSITFI